jgi:hypothetical protein
MKNSLTVILTSLVTAILSANYPTLTIVLACIFFWLYCGRVGFYIYTELDSDGNEQDCSMSGFDMVAFFAMGIIGLIAVLCEKDQIEKLFNKWNIERIEFRKPFIVIKEENIQF